MRKQDELNDTRSCFNRAYPHEMMFVLLARDSAAPIAIRSWINERLRTGKNKMGDEQIVDALKCSETMEAQRTLQELSGEQEPDQPRLTVDIPTVFGVVTHRPKVTVHSHNLREVAQRVAAELTRETSSYNTEPEQRAARRDRGYRGPYQYAPHLVRLGQALQMALEGVSATSKG